MYREASYGDVGVEVAGELGDQIGVATRAGVTCSRIIIDPGLGFAKRAEHTYAALAALGRLALLDRPLLVGPSRKSFLGGDGDGGPDDREWGTAAAVTAVHTSCACTGFARWCRWSGWRTGSARTARYQNPYRPAETGHQE